MKNVLSILLAALLVFSLCACNKEAQNGNPESTAPEVTTEAHTTIAEETTAVPESTEDTTAEDPITEDTAIEDTTAEDTTVEDTTAEDTTVEDTTAEDTTAEDTTAEESTIADTTIAETTQAPITTAPECTHSQIEKVNAIEPTCASAGYSGDEICTLCGMVLKAGDLISKSSTHGETYIKDSKEATTEAEGYTGDTVCSVCNTVTGKGEVIPKKAEEIVYIVCTDPYGNELTVPKGTDILDYSLENASLPATVLEYAQVEAEILRLTNAEREKAGVAPLDNEPLAYFFASTRAKEASVSWSHTRPNGQDFNHIFAEYGVFYLNCGENLYALTNVTADQLKNDPEWIQKFAMEAVDGWMNSDGHRENLLNPIFTSISIGVFVDETTNEAYAVQLFFA